MAGALARATNARLILGVQFEADSPAEAAAESRAMIRVLGRKRIEGFELGNEADLYPHAAFYKSHGVTHYGRPNGWNFASFVPDYTHVAAAMGRVPLAGPAVGSPPWLSNLDQFLTAERGVSLVTFHRYPLQGCSVGPGAPNYPTIHHLLSDPLTTGTGDRFAPFVTTAHAHGLKVRNGEMNSVACGNGHGVADTFASALWVLGALFETANIGADGVNVHTYPGAPDQLFATNRAGSGWRASVAPEYYGLLMFSQAAPAGSHLLQISGASGTTLLRAWATRARNGRIRVVLINDDGARSRTVAIHVSGASGVATLERLQAPSLVATRGVKLGGQTFGAHTTTGLLRGRLHTVKLASTAGQYLVHLPAASAVMLTLR